MTKSILLIAGAFALVLGSSPPAHATVIPTWFNQNDFDCSFSGVLGRSDADIVSNITGADPVSVFMANSGIGPGRGWFAWMSASQQDQIALSSWDGIDESVPREQRFAAFNRLEFDTSSSPLGPGSPAINGAVRPDGGVHICISSVTDPDCTYSNSTEPATDVNYTFFLKFAPVDIPEPNSFAVVSLALLGLGYLRRNLGAVR